MNRLVIVVAASAFAFAVVTGAAGATSTADEPGAARTEGPMLYKQYCATCHGLSAKGDGPTAPSLKKPPSDLTLVQQTGKPFPADHIIHQITGEAEMTSAHGSREMPVWGRAFRYTKGTPPPDLAINRLVEYLKTIQVNRAP